MQTLDNHATHSSFEKSFTDVESTYGEKKMVNCYRISGLMQSAMLSAFAVGAMTLPGDNYARSAVNNSGPTNLAFTILHDLSLLSTQRCYLIKCSMAFAFEIETS